MKDALGNVTQSFYDANGNQTSVIDANLHTTYKVSKEVEVFGTVRNLFDRRYYTSGTFFDTDAIPFLGLTDPRTLSPGAPRAFYAGLRGKF